MSAPLTYEEAASIVRTWPLHIYSIAVERPPEGALCGALAACDLADLLESDRAYSDPTHALEELAAALAACSVDERAALLAAGGWRQGYLLLALGMMAP